QTSDHTQAVVRAVLALGKAFDIPVMAEGIETADQLSMLNAAGCDEAQGFLLGRPAALADIVKNGQITMNHAL
ncbi:MAG: EAL domain-containing protein, partial [Acetobacter sp.]|nr:EAL domain-containing protein [Acetobacter sp.]